LSVTLISADSERPGVDLLGECALVTDGTHGGTAQAATAQAPQTARTPAILREQASHQLPMHQHSAQQPQITPVPVSTMWSPCRCHPSPISHPAAPSALTDPLARTPPHAANSAALTAPLPAPCCCCKCTSGPPLLPHAASSLSPVRETGAAAAAATAEGRLCGSAAAAAVGAARGEGTSGHRPHFSIAHTARLAGRFLPRQHWDWPVHAVVATAERTIGTREAAPGFPKCAERCVAC
jgi:hypothetical protein